MSDARMVSVGVEEEFHILDLNTRQLVPRAEEILARLDGDSFSPELLKSVVETNSRPTVDLLALRTNLLDLRRRLAEAAGELGLGPAASGTVPILDVDALDVSRDARYEQMTEDYQIVAREQLICGAQVHVDVADRDLAMAVVAWTAPWLPMLLALSASSPYWLGADSGYASMRTLVWQRWPTAGVAGSFRTAAEYDQLIADLIKSGVISDPGMVYFDVRPSAHLPTVELRICDACPDVDNVILIAGLFRALVCRAVEQIAAGGQAPPPRAELLRAATWRAARSGLEGDLVDILGAGPGPVPARAMLRRLLEEVRPQLEQYDDWELIDNLAEQAAGRGSSAQRQRRAFARRGLLTDVADLILAETRDVPPAGAVIGVAPAVSAPDQIAPTLLERYQPTGYDEVVDDRGAVRPQYRAVMRTLERLGPDMLDERVGTREAEQHDRGIVFKVAGDERSRPFPFDIVPRIIAAQDWAVLRSGLTQRVRALEAFLRDVYGERAAVADGVVPPWVVNDAPGLRHGGRAVADEAIRVTTAGIDLVRGADGGWLVLEDNLRVPSGIAYALEGRRLAESVLPELGPPSGILRLDGIPALLHEALLAAAPARPGGGSSTGGGRASGGGEPVVAVLSGGPGDSAYFEHTMLAEQMGVALVEPGELLVDDDGAHRVDGATRHRVDVLYRRIDEDELFNAVGADGAPLGPALLRAMRAGLVSVANAPGNGVGDDKVTYAFVPRMVTYYLGEQPVLDDVPTYVCGDPEQCEHVLANLDQLVVKPVDGFGGAGVLIGPHAEPYQLTEAREQILADPRRWIGQEVVALSTHPTWHDSQLQPCAVDLRAFVYAGSEPVVIPAALSRVAPPGSLIVNSSRGGGSKDTWIPRR
ncbi:carboxylate--amine ligase/circularly permuted type 2 ATP-grasp protein [Frankia sp. Ag45/Mut15]|uniref:Putative glutamate--cysteine ligase 2 n=1 Tax=Frankia umida TaxID=573489 RepID=A0ABT0K3S9_9ACTN|nr:carboxylate--amine ligase/circularly permuted type 2 ATP-grasp protein [Frankia umida]MCK9878377.1 carboxylate--amine ligase/circularly permuted type 2 ATP-grasp protein [Frankia umida]